MDFSNVFSSLGAFWQAVAALVCIHLILLAGLYAIGFRPRLRQRLRDFHTAATRGKFFSDFGLLTKLPYLAVIAVLFYFTVFNWAVQITGSVASAAHASITFDEQSYWQDAHVSDPMAQIASATGQVHPQLYEIQNLEYRLLDQFRGQNRDRYDSSIGWWNEKVAGAFFLYNASLLLALALALAAVWLAVRRVRRKSSTSLGKLAGLLLLAGVAIGICAPLARYHAEGIMGARSINQLFVLGDELRFQGLGQQAARTTTPDPELRQYVRRILECHKPSAPFWLTDYLQGHRRLERQLHKILLTNQYGYPHEPPNITGPYVSVYFETDDPSLGSAGDQLCAFLAEHGLLMVQTNYGNTMGSSDNSEFSRSTLTKLVRQWVRDHRPANAYICDRLIKVEDVVDLVCPASATRISSGQS